MKIKQIKTPVHELIDRFNACFKVISERFVNRSEDISVVQLALLCKGHVLFEGPPGTAKSLLAGSIFSMFEGSDAEPVVFYKKQFMANTQAEEVFGPLNMGKFRANESVWEYNTKGMMPRAHFAFLDELYRASDSLLPSMMSILNERTFMNGTTEISCPLLTAIGTTNFITDKPELEAFHDRWLATVLVKPADSSAARRAILDIFMQQKPKLDLPEKFSVQELIRLQEAVKHVKLPEFVFDLYEELSARYRASVSGGVYVSDRRFCEAVRLIQAAALLETNGENYDTVNASCVIAAKYGLMRGTNKEHVDAMDSAIATVIGNYERAEKEEPEILGLEEQCKAFTQRYDPNLSRERKSRLLEKVMQAVESLHALPADQLFTLVKNRDRMNKVISRLEALRETLKAEVPVF